jgi:hypothetical protein
MAAEGGRAGWKGGLPSEVGCEEILDWELDRCSTLEDTETWKMQVHFLSISAAACDSIY